MSLIVLLLHLSTALCLLNCDTHGICNLVRVHDNMTLAVTRGTSYCLDKRGLRTKEALLIRIEYSNKCNLRDIKSLPEQVDADKHVKHIKTQVSYYLCPLECIYVRVKVLYPDAKLCHIVCEILSHALCERGDKHLVMVCCLLIDL